MFSICNFAPSGARVICGSLRVLCTIVCLNVFPKRAGSLGLIGQMKPCTSLGGSSWHPLDGAFMYCRDCRDCRAVELDSLTALDSTEHCNTVETVETTVEAVETDHTFRCCRGCRVLSSCRAVELSRVCQGCQGLTLQWLHLMRWLYLRSIHQGRCPLTSVAIKGVHIGKLASVPCTVAGALPAGSNAPQPATSTRPCEPSEPTSHHPAA